MGLLPPSTWSNRITNARSLSHQAVNHLVRWPSGLLTNRELGGRGWQCHAAMPGVRPAMLTVMFSVTERHRPMNVSSASVGRLPFN